MLSIFSTFPVRDLWRPIQPKVHQTLIDGLSTAGFSYVSGGNPNPADDLRPYNITEPENFQFIAQVWSSCIELCCTALWQLWLIQRFVHLHFAYFALQSFECHGELSILVLWFAQSLESGGSFSHLHAQAEIVFQGRHDAPKYHGVNGDILDFAIYAPKSDSSVLRMFSLSRIHGALLDNGQNYKSLQLGVTIFWISSTPYTMPEIPCTCIYLSVKCRYWQMRLGID